MRSGRIKNHATYARRMVSSLFRFTLEGEFEQLKFTEEMIDHLDIESTIIVAECNEAKLQVRRFGIPPLIGNIYYMII